ncbi:hypothetical protein CLV35_1012 [Motilibacter peucedani]|uniref:Uncharacterized protein n=1 Tax=Motilibacter peucedani TaxID=598650 RepID=A0A420XUR3_9ACTN|nr:hypothetical protein [Motilibacter peucedani]RKS80574.1 hypothetical protein CLV35_1012 [Motilibacter peucedani]
MTDVTVTLTQDEALVLFEWLERASERADGWVDPAEQRVVWDLICSLEKVLPLLNADYGDWVEAARGRLRDPTK